ncbi:SPOR domain-containing protein [Jannaschia sp. S6380]|uniref:SPOR domain-containing protein n=1 Tax=Jannaschia sp. S6380 TaxID=2926408 RepID=UPI001FF1BE08|nr:SPOR domain-containing protein [Jannaschia sp. S6380]MCK0166091.1 SPOR domain-containing protein [Jannaschia sp. S6380]
MADLDYYGADYGVEEPSRLMEAARNFGFVNWAGAVTSIGLTGAMAFWAVDLAFRDVSGVPVVRAVEGPMRVAPENPGGTVAPFQGLALSDITSGGAAAPAPDQIVLAPPPVALDAPALGERREIAEQAVAEAQPEANAAEAEVETVAFQHAGIVAETLALIEAESADGTLVEASASAADDAPAVEEEPEISVAAALPSAVPGVARSARPSQRPAGLRKALAAPAKLPTEAPAARVGVEVASLAPMERTDPVAGARDVDPATVVPGTRVVQLGAFDSEAVARSEWDRLEGRFRDYMAGKKRMIQKARSGGRDFWRLRVVGFADASDARRFCSELLAKDAACIPVTVR